MSRRILFLLICALLLPVSAIAAGLEPVQGRLLVANAQIRDGRFHHAVILLLRHGASGSVGLMLNKPIPLELTDLLPEQDRPHLEKMQIYAGGPVEPATISVLWGGAEPPRGAVTVLPDLAISGVELLLLGLGMGELGDEPFRVFSGYCGWAPGQLEHELRRGDWNVTPGDAEPLLKIDPEKLWERFRSTSDGTLI